MTYVLNTSAVEPRQSNLGVSTISITNSREYIEKTTEANEDTINLLDKTFNSYLYGEILALFAIY